MKKIIVELCNAAGEFLTDLEVSPELSAEELLQILKANQFPGISSEVRCLWGGMPPVLLCGRLTLTACGLLHGSRLCLCGAEIERKFENLYTEGERYPLDNCLELSSCSRLFLGTDRSSHFLFRQKTAAPFLTEMRKSDQQWVLTLRRDNGKLFYNGRRLQEPALLRDGDFFFLDFSLFYYSEGCLWFEDRTDLQLRQLPFSPRERNSRYPYFSPAARILQKLPEGDMEILDPPPAPVRNSVSVLQRLLPSVGMLVMAGLLASAGSGMLVFSCCSAGISMVTAALVMLRERRDHRRRIREREHTYREYITRKRKELQLLRGKEREILMQRYFPPLQGLQHLKRFEDGFFDRRRGDADFLHLYLGTGPVAGPGRVSLQEREQLLQKDALEELPAALAEEFAVLEAAPVCCDLTRNPVAGILGPGKLRQDFLRSLIADLCLRHFPDTISLFVFGNEEEQNSCRWMRFLPHLNETEGLDRNLAWDRPGRKKQMDFLYRELCGREAGKAYDRELVLLFYSSEDLRAHPLSSFPEKAEKLGAVFLMCEDRLSRLLPSCRKIISLQPGQTGWLQTPEGGLPQPFVWQILSEEQAEEMAAFMAPVQSEKILGDRALPETVGLFELLGLSSAEEWTVDRSWTPEADGSLKALVGRSAEGPVGLDLHDRAQGPHLLLGGTTGSGKSEVLVTLILSLAVSYAPSQVAFLVIDFKGGGMLGPLRKLPHMAGLISNIDEADQERSLSSLRAEMERRQRLFAEVGVNHIDDYRKKCRTDGGELLPHLLVIVDEFAELKAEQPDFMKELISASRIGRSLGVHLLLATQKPSGQVDDQIWSNSNVRICLRVQSRSDSSEILHSPLAAEISSPGRGYLQVGSQEDFTLLQFAYSQMPADFPLETGRVLEAAVVLPQGERVPLRCPDLFSAEKTMPGSDDQSDGLLPLSPDFPDREKTLTGKTDSDRPPQSQAEALTEQICRQCREMGIPEARQVFLPPLPELLPVPDIPLVFSELSAQEQNLQVEIGLLDDPEHQEQRCFSVGLEEGNCLLIGPPGCGKTNLLRHVLLALCSRFSPEVLQIYGMDLAGGELKRYEALPQVGGVVCTQEEEDLQQLFRILETEIRDRRAPAGRKSHHRILVLIDNYAALRELYLREEDLLQPLLREGPGCGITFWITNRTTAGIPYAALTSLEQRLLFFGADAGESYTLFSTGRKKRPLLPGRCYMEEGRKLYELQSYRAEALGKVRKKELQKLFGSMSRPGIPNMPERCTAAYLRRQGLMLPERKEIWLGIRHQDRTAVLLQQRQRRVLAILGYGESSWLSFLHFLQEELQETQQEFLCLVDSAGALGEAQWDSAFLTEEPEGFLTLLEKKLEQRGNASRCMILLHHPEAAEFLSASESLLSKLKECLRPSVDWQGFLMFSCLEDRMIGYHSPELLRLLREQQQFLVFRDLRMVQMAELRPEYLRREKKPLLPGDAFLVEGGIPDRIRLGQAEQTWR